MQARLAIWHMFLSCDAGMTCCYTWTLAPKSCSAIATSLSSGIPANVIYILQLTSSELSQQIDTFKMS